MGNDEHPGKGGLLDVFTGNNKDLMDARIDDIMNGLENKSSLDWLKDRLVAESKANEKEEGQATAITDPLLQQMHDALEKGTFDIRKGLGSRFMREVAPGTPEHDEYQGLQSFEQKRDFRMAWLRKKYEQRLSEKTFMQSYRQVDTTIGVYMDFGKVVEEFGVHFDKRRAVKKAMVYCARCLKMKGAWVLYNEMHEDLDYLFVKSTYAQEFTKMWSLYERETKVI